MSSADRERWRVVCACAALCLLSACRAPFFHGHTRSDASATLPVVEETVTEDTSDADALAESHPGRKRFWLFGRKRTDRETVEEVPVEETVTEDTPDADALAESHPGRKRFWLFGRKRTDRETVEDAPVEETVTEDTPDADAVAESRPGRKRFWLFGRKRTDRETAEVASEEEAPTVSDPVEDATAALEKGPQADPAQALAMDEDKSQVTGTAMHVPVLRTGMLLNITVMVAGEKEIEEKSKRIEADGTVSLPLVGKFPAVSKTLAEFQETLRERYNSKFFVNPQVVVDFSREGEEYASPWGHVTVLGAVKTPGRISIPPTQDLVVSQAIQASGGCTDEAKLTSIRVSRFREDGEREAFKVNLNAVGEMRQVDLVLEPGDVIFVPEVIF